MPTTEVLVSYSLTQQAHLYRDRPAIVKTKDGLPCNGPRTRPPAWKPKVAPVASAGRPASPFAPQVATSLVSGPAKTATFCPANRVSFPRCMGTDALLVRRAIDGGRTGTAIALVTVQAAASTLSCALYWSATPTTPRMSRRKSGSRSSARFRVFAGIPSSVRGPTGLRSIEHSTRSAAPNACRRSKLASRNRLPPHRPKMNDPSSGHRSRRQPLGSHPAHARCSCCTMSKAIRMKRSQKHLASLRVDRNRSCSRRARNYAACSCTSSSPMRFATLALSLRHRRHAALPLGARVRRVRNGYHGNRRGNPVRGSCFDHSRTTRCLASRPHAGASSIRSFRRPLEAAL